MGVVFNRLDILLAQRTPWSLCRLVFPEHLVEPCRNPFLRVVILTVRTLNLRGAKKPRDIAIAISEFEFVFVGCVVGGWCRIWTIGTPLQQLGVGGRNDAVGDCAVWLAVGICHDAD